MRQDLKFAIRSLVKTPSFSLLVIATLTLGIGANTAIFSIINVLLLRPLPYEAPERLVALYERNVMGDEQQMSLSPGNFLDWQQGSSSVEHMTAQMVNTVTVSRDTPEAEAERVARCLCSGNLFAMLRVTPVSGRAFRADEDRFEAPRTAVISYDLWQRQFGGSPDVTSQTVRIDNQPYQIVGVAPRGFMYPGRAVQVWVPLLTAIPPQQQIRHDLHFLRVVGRLRAGSSIEQARAELDTIAAAYKNAHPHEATGRGATVIPLHEDIVGQARRPLTILFGAVICVLLIACLNTANLMLTRAAARTREIGIRAALGASRGRIIRQLVAESVLLALLGGAAGAGLAFWLAKLLVVRAPGAGAILPADTVPLELPVLLFTFAVSLITGIAVGLFPAIRGSRANLTTELKDAGRGSIATRGQGRFRDALIASEVALSLVLVIVAGLLIHSFSRLYDVRPGVRTDNVITMSTSLVGPGYAEPAKRSATLEQITERMRRVPGVSAAGLTSCPPLSGSCNALFFYVEGRPYTPGKFLVAMERSVDPGYFGAAGIPLIRGRTFTRQDGVGFDPKNPRPGRVVISEETARQFFPGEDPIGRRIFFDFEMQRERLEGFPAPRYEIVGIVGDVRFAMHENVAPTLYRPALDIASRGVTILLHTSVEPRSIVGAVREEMRRQDPALAIFQVRTMDDLMAQGTADRRFNMLLVASFAALALLLAAVGLYGVVSHAVSQRTGEIGLRMALGATHTSVRRLMLLQGLRPAVAGVALGLIAAWSSASLVRSLLFGIGPTDPITFALAPPLLLGLAALACYVPARRASRLDPTIALRAE